MTGSRISSGGFSLPSNMGVMDLKIAYYRLPSGTLSGSENELPNSRYRIYLNPAYNTTRAEASDAIIQFNPGFTSAVFVNSSPAESVNLSVEYSFDTGSTWNSFQGINPISGGITNQACTYMERSINLLDINATTPISSPVIFRISIIPNADTTSDLVITNLKVTGLWQCVLT